MIRGLIYIFELIRGFIMFLVSLIQTAADFVLSIPRYISYFGSSVSILPSFLEVLFVAAFGFIIIKAIHKYLL